MDYWERVLPSYIENWPAALHSLSIASVDVPLTVGEANLLGANMIDFGECFDLPPGTKRDISHIRQRVADAVAGMPNGAFVRLGSRSPKDSWDGHRNGFKTTPGMDPLRLMLDASERIYEDLTLAIQHGYAPHIWVRQWIDIPRWAEFRCMMRGRKLVGVSQYNYLQGESFPEIVGNHGTIQWVIEQFFPAFREASHLDDVVFDVYLKRWTRRDNYSEWECKLLEINPFFCMTDPCLFAWNKEFDGGLRFNPPPTAAPSPSDRPSDLPAFDDEPEEELSHDDLVGWDMGDQP